MDILPGKKTYILVSLGLIAGIALYIQSVVNVGFNWTGFMQFINSEAVVAALATLRLAFGKK